MKKLLSIANDTYTFNKIGNTRDELTSLLKEGKLDGFEILKVEDIQEFLPEATYIGRHLFFYPIWMDFIKNCKEDLLSDFNSMENAFNYYRAKDKMGFIKNLKEELADAIKDRVEYVVLHVSHMSLEESYSYKYKYSSMEVIKEYVDILNEAMEGLEIEYKILLENNWYPGLNYLESDILRYIVENTNENVGFLLDTGHLINTNPDIENEEEAMDYLMVSLNNIKEYIPRINGIHLNMSITGKYVKDKIKNHTYNPSEDFNIKIRDAMIHISKIDKHEPFIHNGIRKFINIIQPEYLVMELSYKNQSELREKISYQNKFLE